MNNAMTSMITSFSTSIQEVSILFMFYTLDDFGNCLFFSYLLFNILPVFVDIAIAIVFFILAFNIYFGLVVLVTMGLYLGKS